MTEFLNNLTNKEWFITIIAFLTANLGTILSMGIVIIRNKIKNDSMQKAFDEIIAKANISTGQELNDKVEAMKSEIKELLGEQLSLVSQKLKLDSEERKEAVAQKSIEVKDLIDSITQQTMEALNDLDEATSDIGVDA